MSGKIEPVIFTRGADLPELPLVCSRQEFVSLANEIFALRRLASIHAAQLSKALDYSRAIERDGKDRHHSYRSRNHREPAVPCR